MLIRPAQVEDANAIAAVHVAVWNETYRGIMPDTLLDRMNVEERARAWAARIPALATNRQTLMVADDGDVVGFAGCGPRRGDHLPSDGEIYMVNLLSRAKRKHIGAKLMHAMAEALEHSNFQSAGLWVLEKNLPARAFYARLGGTQGVTSQEDNDGVMLTDIAILWPAIVELRDRTREFFSAPR
jgi:ribosomal protein S18 acetylase RimI-like enzyme